MDFVVDRAITYEHAKTTTRPHERVFASTSTSVEVSRQLEPPSDSHQVPLTNFGTLVVALDRVRLRTAVDVRVEDHPLATLAPILVHRKLRVVSTELLDELSIRIGLAID